MGGQQSSRRITIENEESTSVIKVSERVVERLKGSVEEGAKQTVPPNPPPRSFNPVQVHPQKLPIPAQKPAEHEVGPVPINPATTTALDIRKLYEEELRKNNEYWRNRINEVETQNERINNIWQAEYKKAIEEAENNPMLPSRSQETVPCTDAKSTVITCYEKNSGQPLLCANEVQAFSDCVNSVRFRKVLSSIN